MTCMELWARPIIIIIIIIIILFFGWSQLAQNLFTCFSCSLSLTLCFSIFGRCISTAHFCCLGNLCERSLNAKCYGFECCAFDCQSRRGIFLSIAVVVGAATVSARVDLMPHAEICMNIEYTHALNMWFGSSFCLTHAETAAADALFWLYFHPLFARCWPHCEHSIFISCMAINSSLPYAQHRCMYQMILRTNGT